MDEGQDATAQLPVYTIGHSDHTSDAFVALLQQHHIEAVVDVRSQPYSQWVPQFNRELLQRTLEAAGLRYLYLGDLLGGRPSDGPRHGHVEGQFAQQELATHQGFQAGIERLLQIAAEQPTVIMCAEGNHGKCHRGRLITPMLLQRGAKVLHIQPDGDIIEAVPEPKQLTLL